MKFFNDTMNKIIYNLNGNEKTYVIFLSKEKNSKEKQVKFT